MSLKDSPLIGFIDRLQSEKPRFQWGLGKLDDEVCPGATIVLRSDFEFPTMVHDPEGEKPFRIFKNDYDVLEFMDVNACFEVFIGLIPNEEAGVTDQLIIANKKIERFIMMLENINWLDNIKDIKDQLRNIVNNIFGKND